MGELRLVLRHLFAVTTALLVAAPAQAQINAYYRGTERVGTRAVPATAQLSLEKGRVAITVKGAHPFRMILVEKDETFRIIDDVDRTYLDVESGGDDDVMSDVEKELTDMSPEDQKLFRQTMAQALGSPSKVTYVASKDSIRVTGVPCTRVDVLHDGVKKGEYWCTIADAYKVGDGERATMRVLNESLGGALPIVQGSGGSGVRAFEWDTSKAGFPLITRCVDGQVVTLDLTLEAFDRKPLVDAWFKIPKGYRKTEMSPGP
jgi:hypothetical protein